MCASMSWTGCPPRTDSCGTGWPPTTRRSSRCRTVCGRCWRTSGSPSWATSASAGPTGVSPARLAELYHAVVYCVGASADRALAVPGENLPGSYSATRFVSWYSAHPDIGADPFARDALGARSAVVIGVGNVAVDVARILARGAGELRRTDVPSGALRALEESRVREVHIVGRRGPLPGPVHHQG
ncbi:hypothetical protein GA0115255_111353, partial [Streptomyces sp. Ncost-T6T-2b]